MFFDFDDDDKLDPCDAPDLISGKGSLPAPSFEARASHVKVAVQEDKEFLEDAERSIVSRFGEGHSSEYQCQLLLNLQSERVELLGGHWQVLNIHGFRYVEIRPDPCRDPKARKPQVGERILVRLRVCIPVLGKAAADFEPLDSSEEQIDCILSDGSLPDGVELALPTIGEGETAQVRCIGEMALRDVPADRLQDVPPEGFLVWEVQLLTIVSVTGVDNPKCYSNFYVADIKQRMARAFEFYARGNALLKAGRVVKATSIFELGEDFTSVLELEEPPMRMRGVEGPLDREQQPPSRYLQPKAAFINAKIKELRLSILLNHSLALQKQGLWQGAADLCTEALRDCDASSAKAFFMRGKSRIRLKEFHAAREDLKWALNLDCALRSEVNRELQFLRQLELMDQQASTTAAKLGAKPRKESFDSKTTRMLDGESQPVQGRVSVICPTTESRHDHHPQLYGCFLCQTYPDTELIVVDSGLSPSYFFSCLSDPHVTYIHIGVKNDMGSSTIGAKRNLALQHATGEWVAHFDDDDLYAPPYLWTMVQVLEQTQKDVAKLCSWHTLDAETGLAGFYDNDHPLPGPFEESRRSGLFTIGYGFSLVYKREVARRIPFADTSWGEDEQFMNAVNRLHREESVVFKDLTFQVLHVQHGDNMSRIIAQHHVQPERWKFFVVQLHRHIVTYMNSLDRLPRAVSLTGKWDSLGFIAWELRASMELGTARFENPDPAPLPKGLFICSLYDEYCGALKEYRSAQENSQLPVRASEPMIPEPLEETDSLDPLSYWEQEGLEHYLGMRQPPENIDMRGSAMKPVEV